MKAAKLALAISLLTAGSAFAEPTLYGKANVSFQAVSEDDNDTTEVKSNASRIGIKGTEKLEGGLEVVYQAEFEVQFDDGNDKNGETFSQRNIFLGLKGDFGMVRAGRFDTPLKTAQKKVDLFNDLEGDIKNVLTDNDIRADNITEYASPKLGDVNVKVALVSSEDENTDNGVSMSVNYDTKNLYLAAAFDSGVKGEDRDTLRLVAQYKVGQFQLGALVEQQEEGNVDKDGWMLSGQYKINKIALKAQAGKSDIEKQDATAFNLGVDYKLSKKFKTFAYFSTNEWMDGAADIENRYLGVGAELKF